MVVDYILFVVKVQIIHKHVHYRDHWYEEEVIWGGVDCIFNSRNRVGELLERAQRLPLQVGALLPWER